MQQILILGNGLSRLLFDKKIKSFKGEVWGCNRVYLDYGEKLTLLYGHQDVVREGGLYRDEHHLHYKLAGTNEYQLQCNFLYRKDSGSTLAAEALTRGYKIILCGFDLGGPDLYSPGMETKNKSVWVDRWRLIYKKFGSQNITWWGHDHSAFIMSGRDRSEYYRNYSNGKSHLPEEEYKKLLGKDTVQDVMDRLPCAILHNIGKREWTFYEFNQKIGDDGRIKMPLSTCEKYKTLYPGDFEICMI